jgi:hypothetical protein
MRGRLWFGAATAALMMAGLVPVASAQDQGGDASTEARFSAGQTVEGEISPAGDLDWFRMRVEQGQRYSFTLDGVADAEGGALDPMLAIYDAQGNQLAFNDDANGLNSALHYAPAQSGDVFVEARAFSHQATARYTLNPTAAPVPPDDAGNDAGTRARINVGRAVTGSLEFEGDTDWYRFNARTGQSYHVTLVGTEGAATPLGDPLLRVLDREGNELAANDDSDSLNSALDFVPRANGEVFIEARGYADAYAGSYTLNVSAERLPTDSISADRYTRGRITLGQSVSGSLDFPSDTDWYRVRLTAGQSYRFALAGAGDSPLSDPLLRIHGADGAELGFDDDGGEGLNSYMEFTAATTGNYFLEASPFGGEGVGGYTLTAQTGDIPADATTDVGLSADGDYREGMLAPTGDRDWYRIELAEGQALRINAVSAESDPLSDPYLVLYGPDGTEITRDDDGGEGLNAYLEYQAAAAGAHYLEVRGFSDDAQGRYVVSITPGEIGASVDTADYLQPGGEGRASSIGAPDDVDWFAIELIEGRPYRFNLIGAGPGASEDLADPYLTLYDANGNQVAADDDGGAGLNSYLSFASPTGGPYFAAVSSFGASGTGGYTLSVSDTDVPGNVYTDENLDAADDGRASRIEMPGDLDYYRVTLEAGARYVIDVRGDGEHPLADPFLTIMDSQNERVTSDDDGGDGLDARLRFTPAQPGEYYIQASGLGGSTGTYQVSIVRQ